MLDYNNNGWNALAKLRKQKTVARKLLNRSRKFFHILTYMYLCYSYSNIYTAILKFYLR